MNGKDLTIEEQKKIIENTIKKQEKKLKTEPRNYNIKLKLNHLKHTRKYIQNVLANGKSEPTATDLIENLKQTELKIKNDKNQLNKKIQQMQQNYETEFSKQSEICSKRRNENYKQIHNLYKLKN